MTKADLIVELCNTNDGSGGFMKADLEPGAVEALVAEGVVEVLADDGDELGLALTKSYMDSLVTP